MWGGGLEKKIKKSNVLKRRYTKIVHSLLFANSVLFLLDQAQNGVTFMKFE
jgi:hypothetical protein